MCLQEIGNTDKPVTWSGFKKALVLSAGTAIGGAAVAMLINTATDTPCTVTGDCSQISDIMKGETSSQESAGLAAACKQLLHPASMIAP